MNALATGYRAASKSLRVVIGSFLLNIAVSRLAGFSDAG
jgi:hypothetical protein